MWYVVSLRGFGVGLLRWVISPLLAPGFTLIALVALLLGPFDRRGQVGRVVVVIVGVVVMQSLYLTAFNLAQNSNVGLVLMYILVAFPIGFCGFILSKFGENFRRALLFKRGEVI